MFEPSQPSDEKTPALQALGRDRRPILVDTTDPDVERVHLMGQATLAALIAALATAIAVSELSLAATPIGWLATAFAALIGLTAPVAFRWRQRRQTTRLPVWQLSPRWADPVLRAAEQAERLQHLADRSPDGPIADHFERLATTADGYVVSLHRAAMLADTGNRIEPTSDDLELRTDMRRINAQLVELVEAAERLRTVQRDHLESSPLTDLTAETDRLTAAIEADARNLS